MAQFNLAENSDVTIKTNSQGILITPSVNPRKNWNEAFQEAFRNGDNPETDYFANMKNEFDEKVWTW